MRIGLVHTGAFRGAGVERAVYETARNLAERHEVTVFADFWEESETPGIAYERVGPLRWPRPLAPLEFARRSTRAVARHDLDRVLSFGVNCPAGDVIWVNSVHAAWLERKGRGVALARRLRPVDRVLLELERDRYGRRRYTRLLAVAEGVADDLGRIYGVPRREIEIVPNGFDPEEFSPERRSALREEERARLGLDEDEVALLVVANELRRKGVPVLLEAVARLGDPRVKVLLAGRADPRDERVRWLGSVSDVGRAHAAADLFVLPTRYEAASLAVVEALASGLPVITTDVPGARDLVEPGVNGLLQRDPLDAEELAELLSTALDPEARRRWSADAARSVAELTWPRICERLEAILANPSERSHLRHLGRPWAIERRLTRARAPRPVGRLLDAFTVERPPPANLDPGDERLFAHEYRRSFGPTDLYLLRRVHITSDGAVLHRARHLEALTLSPELIGVGTRYIARALRAPTRRFEDPDARYVTAFNLWSTNYFHWMCDVLPRLYSMREQVRGATIVLPASHAAPFVDRSLAAFEPHEIVRFGPGETAWFRQVLVPGHIGLSGNYHEPTMRALAGFLREILVEERGDPGPELVFASRRDADYRHVTNREAVEAALSSYGFVTVYNQEMTVAEQIRIYSSARVVVGVMGANLTNVMFMPASSVLLQLSRAGDRHNHAYYALAAAVGVRFHNQSCDFRDTRPGNFWDLTVDVDELRRNVERILASLD